MTKLIVRHCRLLCVDLAIRYRRLLIVVLELALVALSNYLAFWLRFDGVVPDRAFDAQLRMLPWLIVIRGLTFIPFRLYAGLWRYTGLWELRSIVFAVTTSSVLFYVTVRSPLGTGPYPRSIFILDAVVLICLLTTLRLSQRVYREMGPGGRKNQRRVLVFGAGDAGEMIVRDMRHSRYKPVGFMDDNRGKVGQHIHGVPVVGTRADLSRVMLKHKPQEVLIAVPGIDGAVVRELMSELEPFKVSLRTLPKNKDLIHGTVTVNQIRGLSIEDLLARRPVDLKPERVRDLIRGKRVLVTGAGGSIGSELSRQIAMLKPDMLILFERYENSLYAIANDLADHGHAHFVRPVIGDVTDAARLEFAFAEYAPEIVFHAAAHKHVPLMELNAGEAVKNNIIGTRMVAEAAGRHGAERFIMISTDKAVNPTSVMGATKRVAELTVQALASKSWTSFVTVRFGNVLGSNGSVVLRFQQQIAAGVPVTVTHPEMRRFFMLIPEAVQLVLHAAAIGTPGAVYVLEMGEQIKLVDMAKNLIRLSGFVPDEQIPITFVGLRPGEKLFEELVGADETVRPSAVEKILQVEPQRRPDTAAVMLQIREVEQRALRGDLPGVMKQLATIIPTFRLSEYTVAAAPVESTRTDANDSAADERRTGRALAGRSALGSAGCPSCGSAVIHRRRVRSAHGRLHKKLTRRRPHHCEVCGWRGWVTPPPILHVEPAILSVPEALDFDAIDVALNTSRHSQSPGSGTLARPHGSSMSSEDRLPDGVHAAWGRPAAGT